MPTSQDFSASKKGFTLIELLVVVAIIAILSLIGMTVYSSVQQRARDAKRRADVDSIVKVYEQKYQPLSAQYSPIQSSGGDFASGKIPTPPEGGTYTGYDTENQVSGFQICATLEDGQTYCRSSSLGRLATTGTTPPPPGGVTFKPLSCENFGDMDKDGQITQNDVQIISNKLLANTLSNDEKIIADVNYDGSSGLGTVSLSDVQHLNNYVNNSITNLTVCANIKPPPCDGMGDVSGDGKVTPMDAVEVTRMAVGGFNSLYTGQPYTNDQRTRADVNNSGTVNSTDAFIIQQYLVSIIITNFPACIP